MRIVLSVEMSMSRASSLDMVDICGEGDVGRVRVVAVTTDLFISFAI